MPLTVILVNKDTNLKQTTIKNFNLSELYKKCGFKKADDFIMRNEWDVKINHTKYFVQLFGKIEGKATMENKYEFPPPIDNILFFGTCALVSLCYDEHGKKNYCNLTLELWHKIYEQLFGGFEDITDEDDLNTTNKLKNIHKNDSAFNLIECDDLACSSDDIDSNINDDDDNESSNQSNHNDNNDNDINLLLDDIGSELSEESYIE